MTDRGIRIPSELLSRSCWDQDDHQYSLLAANIAILGVRVDWIASITRVLTPEQIAGIVVFIGTIVWSIGAAYTLLNQDAGLTIRL